MMDIHWAGTNTNKTYTTTIRIETADKMGLLKDIIAAVSDNNTNIITANVKSRNNVGIIEIGLELDNIETLKKVTNCLQALPDVFSVKRIQTSAQTAAPKRPNNNKQRPQKRRRN